MKIVGFTIIRNALKYDYPVVEAIESILPLCDEVIVSVGQSEDGTLDLIESIQSAKIRIVQSQWDENLRKSGQVLAEETNKAMDQIPADADWCLYIQADEVIHEKYYPVIRQTMATYEHDATVEGLLFKYLHFYASYDYVGDSRKWYSHEIRIVRRDPQIRSYLDAQGFRKSGHKLQVKLVDAYIYHYGWVKPPSIQLQKINDFHKLWSDQDSELIDSRKIKDAAFDYAGIDSLQKFTGTHPLVMQERIRRKNWHIDLDLRRKKFSIKGRVLYWIEQKTGIRLFEYRNYKIV